MIDNTSRTHAYLTAVGDTPCYDDDLETVFRQFIAGVTGLSENEVRSIWQPPSGNVAAGDVNWCVTGVTSFGGNCGASIVHYGTDAFDPDDGRDVLSWQEELELETCFYGPKAGFYAALLKYGCLVKQNADQLLSRGLVFVSADKTVTRWVTENNLSVKETSLKLDFRRHVSFTYQVRNLAGAIVHSFK